jgi:hypothetical protein
MFRFFTLRSALYGGCIIAIIQANGANTKVCLAGVLCHIYFAAIIVVVVVVMFVC